MFNFRAECVFRYTERLIHTNSPIVSRYIEEKKTYTKTLCILAKQKNDQTDRARQCSNCCQYP